MIATTARHRKQVQSVLEPPELAAQIAEEPEERTTAILFGREDFGLTSDIVHRCEALVRIPTPEHASLNLAQAVLLVGHAVFEARRARGIAAPGRRLGGRRGTKATGELAREEHPADLIAVDGAVSSLVAL
jgi:tRNA C32,U32 (ribose-2'-O)-methylase TrmJ